MENTLSNEHLVYRKYKKFRVFPRQPTSQINALRFLQHRYTNPDAPAKFVELYYVQP